MSDNQKNRLAQKLTRSVVCNNPTLQEQIITPNDQSPFAKSKTVVRSTPENNISAQRKDQETVTDIGKFNKTVIQNLEEIDQETNIEQRNKENATGAIKKAMSKLNEAHLTINISTTPNKQELTEILTEERKVAPVTLVTPLTEIRKSQNRTSVGVNVLGGWMDAKNNTRVCV